MQPLLEERLSTAKAIACETIITDPTLLLIADGGALQTFTGIWLVSAIGIRIWRDQFVGIQALADRPQRALILIGNISIQTQCLGDLSIRLEQLLQTIGEQRMLLVNQCILWGSQSQRIASDSGIIEFGRQATLTSAISSNLHQQQLGRLWVQLQQ